MKNRADNKLLIESVNDFCRNFLKFNIMETDYIRTMNTVLSMEDLPLPIDLFVMVNRYLHYIEQTKKKASIH